MKFGNEFWLILFREYISPKLFAVCIHKLGLTCLFTKDKELENMLIVSFTFGGHVLIISYKKLLIHLYNSQIELILQYSSAGLTEFNYKCTHILGP
jgi:hypothetical protein